MRRLPFDCSLTKRWRRFYKSLPDRQVTLYSLSKALAFCQSNPVICGILWLLAIVILPFILGPNLINPISDNDYSESLKSLGFLLGAGIAPLGLYLTYNRTQSLRMQTDTDTFTKSIKLLGNSSSAVRQGGIYSLGGIARDNSKLHTTIMKIMASYIREKTDENLNKLLKQEGLQKNSKEEVIQKQSEESSMPSDIEAAIEVIKRRKTNNDQPLESSKKSFPFDLSNSYIFNADFSFTKLPKTNFSDSIMLECIFDGSDLSDSLFASSNLKRSSFIESTLKNCDFQECDLSGSEFENCDLTDVKNLTQEQIDSVKVDRATKLPRGIRYPRTS